MLRLELLMRILARAAEPKAHLHVPETTEHPKRAVVDREFLGRRVLGIGRNQ